jgi:hypothetical protein
MNHATDGNLAAIETELARIEFYDKLESAAKEAEENYTQSKLDKLTAAVMALAPFDSTFGAIRASNHRLYCHHCVRSTHSTDCPVTKLREVLTELEAQHDHTIARE